MMSGEGIEKADGLSNRVSQDRVSDAYEDIRHERTYPKGHPPGTKEALRSDGGPPAWQVGRKKCNQERRQPSYHGPADRRPVALRPHLSMGLPLSPTEY